MPDPLAIQIDPSLLEAAVAAVELRTRRHGPPAATADAPQEEGELTIPPEFAHLRGPEEAVSEPEASLRQELARTHARLAELEVTLATERAGREHADAQVRELRATASAQFADFERFRQRARKEREEAERTGEERALTHLLDTCDNLDRALLHVPEDAPVVRGLRMVVHETQSRLRRLGVERVPATRGTRFDPELHEAVHHISTPDAEPGAVIDEVSAGYRLRGRLLRPARVTVAAPTEP